MLRAYLAGPMESHSDSGIGWRDKLYPRLLELGIIPLDPTRDLQKERPQEWYTREQNLQKAKSINDKTTFIQIMREIWWLNKKGVDEADFIIVYAENYTQLSGGTLREMHEASLYKKPIFLVFEGDPWKFYSHPLYLVFDNGEIFKSFDELFNFIKQEVITNPRFKQHHVDLFHVAQKLFVIDKDKLLILKDAHRDYFDVPGGRLNVDEFGINLEEALAREVKEELGEDIKLSIEYTPVAVGRVQLWDKVLNRPHYRRVFMLFYEASYLGGEIQLSDEHTFYKWVDINTYNPEDQFPPGYTKAIQQFLVLKREK